MTEPERSSAAAIAPRLDGLATLDAVQARVLWLAIRIVDAANRERARADGVKVGGHQASTASMVTLMTALWFAYLRPGDRVAVKPHAAPVLHAISYLLGRLDRSYRTRLRSFGGLQPYPHRTKDPFPVDFSTGSVGLGAVAPLFAAAVRRYVEAHFGPRPPARFIALLGDVDLDAGSIWEAIADPVTAGLGNVLWVIDLNRQSRERLGEERLRADVLAGAYRLVDAGGLPPDSPRVLLVASVAVLPEVLGAAGQLTTEGLRPA